MNRLSGLVTTFFAILIAALLISLWLHLLWQDHMNLERGSDMLFSSYLVNFLLAALIFLVLFGLRNKYKNQIGFMYLGGSLLKFLIFFLLFYPPYREDGMVTKTEFAAFFIPYLLCLVMETVFTAKILLKEQQE